MPEPVLHKYFDFGERALANLTLQSGERVLLTVLPNGFAVHRLHFFGVIPGACLFGANAPAIKQMTTVLTRDAGHLPLLPRAKGTHRIEPTRLQPADAMSTDKAPRADSVDDVQERPLSLFTRLALTARDAEDLVRLYERTRNTVG
jgi:hypothetical protein